MDNEDILWAGNDGFYDPPIELDKREEEKGKKKEAEQDTINGSYMRLFSGQGSASDADVVVRDLYRMCWGAVSSFSPEPTVLAYREGSRAVLLRILRNAGRKMNGARG